MKLDFVQVREAVARAGDRTVAALEQARAGPVRRRALSPLSALKNWRLGRRYRLALVEEAEVVDAAPAGRAPRCETCQESCCRGPGTAVRLRLSDIARLVDAGLEHAIAPPSEGSADAGVAALETLDAQRRFPTLRRRDGDACVFLDDDERCAIHPIRPLACRAYPLLLEPAEGRVRWASGCRSFTTGASEHERRAAVAATLRAYHEKVSDLVVLTHGRRELERVGLARHLPVVD